MRVSALLKLVLPIVILALAGCGGEKSADGSGERTTEIGSLAAQPDLKNVPVTLKPPYSKWKWNKDDPNPRLSLHNAVEALTEQTGMFYDRKRSSANTNPAGKRWVYPSIKNKPWKEAVEEIITPFGLTYVIENNVVVLMTVEDANNLANVREQLAADIAGLLSSDSKPARLSEPVIVLPLLNADGRTTELGTLLSELAMLKATYTPKKTFNVHVPSVIELYHEMGLDKPGKSISTGQRERIKAQFRTNDLATGTLDLKDDGTFRLVLEMGDKEFSTVGPATDLDGVPRWIAGCIFDYRDMDISVEQKEFLEIMELRTNNGLSTLEALERGFRRGVPDISAWLRFSRANPDSVFALYRCLVITKDDEEKNEYLTRLTAARRSLGGHDLQRFLEAQWYHSENRFQYSLPILIELLRSDPCNDAIYRLLYEGMMESDFGDQVDAVHNLWVAADPDSYLPLYEIGRFDRAYGWKARGSGFARTVAAEGWAKLNERVRIAEEYLTRAYELNPTDPRVPTELISVAIIRRHDRDTMEQWFNKAIAADPGYYKAYKTKFLYLSPMWYGNPQEMFEFARECASNPPEDTKVPLMLVEAHRRMAYYVRKKGDDWRDYFRKPEVWKEVKALYRDYLAKYPDAIEDRNEFAQWALTVNDFDEAVDQFELIGTDIATSVWGTKTNFYECRAKAFAQAKGGDYR